MYNDQRRGDSWKLNDLRALLFGHYARESKATSGPLAIEGFSRQSVKKKMQKMRKVLGDDVMNFATSSTDVEELDAIRQERMQQILHSYNPIALTHGWQAFVPLMTSKRVGKKPPKERCGQTRRTRLYLPR